MIGEKNTVLQYQPRCHHDLEPQERMSLLHSNSAEVNEFEGRMVLLPVPFRTLGFWSLPIKNLENRYPEYLTPSASPICRSAPFIVDTATSSHHNYSCCFFRLLLRLLHNVSTGT